MKSALLTLIILGFAALQGSIQAQAQGFYIDWVPGNALVASEEESILEITGTLHETEGTNKRLLFTYDMTGIVEEHTVSLCFEENCFFLFPEYANDPLARDAQNLEANGTVQLYADCYPLGVKGQTTVTFCIFDSVDIDDKLCFSLYYAAGVPLVSVRDSRELGLTVGPNPTSDVVTISGELAQTITTADLFNNEGVRLRSYSVSPSTAQTFSLVGVAAGSYHLMLTLADGTRVRSAIVVL